MVLFLTQRNAEGSAEGRRGFGGMLGSCGFWEEDVIDENGRF